MTTRNASRGLAAAALTGGLTFGLGVAAPAANAMPATDGARSVGALCQAGREASTTATPTTSTPTTSTGLPGLHCGQMFGQAAAVSLSRVHASADDNDSTDETTEETTDDVGEATSGAGATVTGQSVTADDTEDSAAEDSAAEDSGEATTDDSDEVTEPDSTDTDRSTQSTDESDSEDASGGHNSPAEDSHEHADLPDEAGSRD